VALKNGVVEFRACKVSIGKSHSFVNYQFTETLVQLI